MPPLLFLKRSSKTIAGLTCGFENLFGRERSCARSGNRRDPRSARHPAGPRGPQGGGWLLPPLCFRSSSSAPLHWPRFSWLVLWSVPDLLNECRLAIDHRFEIGCETKGAVDWDVRGSLSAQNSSLLRGSWIEHTERALRL